MNDLKNWKSGTVVLIREGGDLAGEIGVLGEPAKAEITVYYPDDRYVTVAVGARAGQRSHFAPHECTEVSRETIEQTIAQYTELLAAIKAGAQ